MAYRNFLASVPADQITAYRQKTCAKLTPSSLITTTHALVSMTPHEDLRSTVEYALDGGEVFDESLWHPFRSPRLHSPATIANLAARMRASLDAFLATIPEQDRQWYEMDLGPVISLFDHASLQGEAVISALEPPFDMVRADRVIIPFDTPDMPSK